MIVRGFAQSPSKFYLPFTKAVSSGKETGGGGRDINPKDLGNVKSGVPG